MIRARASCRQVHQATWESVWEFTENDTKWETDEALIMSNTCTEDFLQRIHPKNKGKTYKSSRNDSD